MSFKEVQFMTPLPCEGLSKKDEEIMKEWLENYRPVRQRTVRSETTKDKSRCGHGLMSRQRKVPEAS